MTVRRAGCGAKDGRRGLVCDNSDRTLGYKCTCKHVSCNTQQAGRPELAAVLVRRGRAAPGKLRLKRDAPRIAVRQASIGSMAPVKLNLCVSPPGGEVFRIGVHPSSTVTCTRDERMLISTARKLCATFSTSTRRSNAIASPFRRCQCVQRNCGPSLHDHKRRG